MAFRITPRDGILYADLVGRETVAQTRAFLEALADAALTHGATRILISVKASRPIFKVEQYDASAYLKELAARPDVKVALVAGRDDLRSAHEYIAVLARQRNANLQSFADTASALAWLQAGEAPNPESQSQEKR